MDSNPASPAYVNGPLGDRLYRYTSAMITTTAMAQEVANNLLAEVALIEESISLGAVTHPALGAGGRHHHPGTPVPDGGPLPGGRG